MKNHGYELVSGIFFGILAALQAIRALLRYQLRWVLTRCQFGSLGSQNRRGGQPLHMGIPHWACEGKSLNRHNQFRLLAAFAKHWITR